MADLTFTINGATRSVEDIPEWLPMLWVLRDKLGITGPKYGCGVGACRACTCHIEDGRGGFEEFQPCITPAVEVAGKRVRTIEGLADGDQLHPVQQAWLELDVPQCGFCQPGQIMTATALLANNRGRVSDEEIDAIENVCRCGTYSRIRQAIKRAAENMDGRRDPDFAGPNNPNEASRDQDPPRGRRNGQTGQGTPTEPLDDQLDGGSTDPGPDGGGDGLLGGLLGR